MVSCTANNKVKADLCEIKPNKVVYKNDLWAWLPSQKATATWYDGRTKRCSLETGKVVPDSLLGVANNKLNKGTLVLLTLNNKSILAVVNDRGVLREGVEFDLSKEIADSLGMLKTGISQIDWKVVGSI